MESIKLSEKMTIRRKAVEYISLRDRQNVCEDWFRVAVVLGSGEALFWDYKYNSKSEDSKKYAQKKAIVKKTELENLIFQD